MKNPKFALSPIRMGALAFVGGAGNQQLTQQQIDAAGVFFQTELQRIDPVLVQPIANFPYERDIDIVPLDIADEQTGFDLQKLVATGGANPAGKSFVGRRTTVIGVAGSDMERNLNPTFPWAEMVQASIWEVATAQRLGRSLDQSNLDALRMKWNSDSQGMVMRGDADVGAFGLVNSPLVATSNAPAGAGGQTTWVNKTPDEMLADVNAVLQFAWAAGNYDQVPTRIGLPPLQFARLTTTKIANTAVSLGQYLTENNLATRMNGQPLQFVPMKELVGAGVGGTDRLIAYTKDRANQRWARTGLLNLPVQADSVFLKTTYYGKMGVVEIPRPHTLRYLDGI